MAGKRDRFSPLLAGVLALATASVAFGQRNIPPPPPPDEEPYELDESAIISVDVDIVNVMATVRGDRGELLGDLEQSDFRLFEDGEEQQIKYFSRENDLPLTIGLLVDVSGSQEALIGIEQQAASRFFQEVLRDQDLAFLIQFGKDAELLQDLTNSPSLLEDGLAELQLSAPVSQAVARPGPVPTLNSNPAGTILYDAIFLAAEERLKQEVGRKVVVVITDGVDQGSKLDRDDAIRAAHQADAAIYGIYYRDRRFGGSDRDLKRMAEETGGSVFKVDQPRDLERVFAQIEEEMRSQYAIGYTPTNSVKDGSFRELEFKMSDNDYKVQARKGYYATDEGF